jgi:hypothetical protein
MLQPHSLLWHCLWLGPCVELAALALLMRKRGLHREFPAFFVYAVLEAAGGATIYAIDLSTRVSATVFWSSFLLFQVVEGLIKLVVIGEVFTHLLRRYPSLGKLAKVLISSVGAVLVFSATIIAAYANPTPFWLISASRILGRSLSVVQCGLILFLFIFAAYFHLRWQRPVFGITLGLGISASVALAVWALMAGWLFGPKSYLLDFLTMATHQVCVLIWFYYLLAPGKSDSRPGGPPLPPEHQLEVWNHELERLIHQ